VGLSRFGWAPAVVGLRLALRGAAQACPDAGAGILSSGKADLRDRFSPLLAKAVFLCLEAKSYRKCELRFPLPLDGQYDSVPQNCLVSQLSFWSSMAQLLQKVVSVMSCMPKVCLLNQGSFLLVARRENGLTEIQRVTLQPCWCA